MSATFAESVSLRQARELRRALTRAAAALPDEALGLPAASLPGHPTLERALSQAVAVDIATRGALRDALASRSWQPSAAARHLEWAPIARARLEAALVGVPDALLDAQPFPGEWTVRQQLAHVLLTDARYRIATLYGARRRDDEPLAAPATLYPPRQADPMGEPGQSLDAILAELRAVRAEAYAALLEIPEDRLQRPIEWHTAEHTVGFRLHRFAQHDLELTTDIRATLAAAGFRPTQAIQLAAKLIESWGEIESVLFAVPAPVLDSIPDDGAFPPGALLAALQAMGQALLDAVADDRAAQ